MSHDQLLVGEESAHEVAEALGRLTFRPAPDGTHEGGGECAAPLLRAMLRWEARLLVEDAAGIAADGRVRRTGAQRRHDALVALAQEVAGALGCDGPAR